MPRNATAAWLALWPPRAGTPPLTALNAALKSLGFRGALFITPPYVSGAWVPALGAAPGTKTRDDRLEVEDKLLTRLMNGEVTASAVYAILSELPRKPPRVELDTSNHHAVYTTRDVDMHNARIEFAEACVRACAGKLDQAVMAYGATLIPCQWAHHFPDESHMRLCVSTLKLAKVSISNFGYQGKDFDVHGKRRSIYAIRFRLDI